MGDGGWRDRIETTARPQVLLQTNELTSDEKSIVGHEDVTLTASYRLADLPRASVRRGRCVTHALYGYTL